MCDISTCNRVANNAEAPPACRVAGVAPHIERLEGPHLSSFALYLSTEGRYFGLQCSIVLDRGHRMGALVLTPCGPTAPWNGRLCTLTGDFCTKEKGNGWSSN